MVSDRTQKGAGMTRVKTHGAMPVTFRGFTGSGRVQEMFHVTRWNESPSVDVLSRFLENGFFPNTHGPCVQ